MSNYKWSLVTGSTDLQSKFQIGELVRCVSKSDETLFGSWVSYGEIGLVRKTQFFKREKIEEGKKTAKNYPTIICEIEVFWLHKNDTFWLMESLLEPLEI